MEPQDVSRLARVAGRVEPKSRLIRTWRLRGGISAHVAAIEIQHPNGRRQKLVVRRHAGANLAADPAAAVHEFRLLQILHSAGLPVPEPYHLDESCEIFPAPYLVLEYVGGSTDVAPAESAGQVQQFASCLSAIHALDTLRLTCSFLPRRQPIRPQSLAPERAAAIPERERALVLAILESDWSVNHRNRCVLLHGDFWPGNVLWRDGRLVAVIDWEDAAIGDPLADLANSRLEVLWAFGPEAMQRFTCAYQAQAAIDTSNLPYWDLCAALGPAAKFGEWAPDEASASRLRAGYTLFVQQAIAALSDRRTGGSKYHDRGAMEECNA